MQPPLRPDDVRKTPTLGWRLKSESFRSVTALASCWTPPKSLLGGYFGVLDVAADQSSRVLSGWQPSTTQATWGPCGESVAATFVLQSEGPGQLRGQ